MLASSDNDEVSSVSSAYDANTEGRSVAAIVAPNHAGNHVPPLVNVACVAGEGGVPPAAAPPGAARAVAVEAGEVLDMRVMDVGVDAAVTAVAVDVGQGDFCLLYTSDAADD